MLFIKKEKGLWKNIFLLLAAFLTSLAITMNMEVIETVEVGIENPIFKIVYKLIEIVNQTMADRGLLLTLLTFSLFAVYKKIWIENSIEIIRYSKGLALFFSIMYTGGKAFEYGNSLSVIYASSIRIMKSLILIIGFYALYLSIINYLYFLLHQNNDIVIKDKKIFKLYTKHTWPSIWLGIMLCWMAHILLRYPGVMGYDNWDELGQYFGVEAYTTAQPVFHTWILGSFVKFGVLLGSANLGLFLLVIFQALLMSAVLSYSLLLMKKRGTFLWLRILTMGIYCISPYYAGYVSFPIKDFLYMAFFLLFFLCITELAADGQNFWHSRFQRNMWIISACFMILFRKNGKYIYLSFLGILGIVLVKYFIDNRKKQLYLKTGTIIICLVLPLMLAEGITSCIKNYYHVEQDSPKEMFSIPFQQTARYVRDYGDEISEEEVQVIRKVLDYDRLPVIYSELTADPVKSTYHADNFRELADYFCVWFKQLLKHPMCYIEAVWNQNYYVFSPDIDNIVYNKNCHVGEEIKRESGLFDIVYFEVPQFLEGVAEIMVSYYSLMTRFPVIGMFSNVAFYIMLMFIIIIYMMHDKCRRGFLVMFPLFVSFITILMAPQIQEQPRYAFPIIYAIPSAVSFYCFIVKRGIGNDKAK